jgi:hypothetical protein
LARARERHERGENDGGEDCANAHGNDLVH